MENHLRHLSELKKGDTCLNCGHNLHEHNNFCPKCGQINDTKRLTFIDWIKEILGDFFAYDSRLSNSLIPLLKNPGQLSIDYIKGQRASHIHPIRFYLVVSFIMFFLMSLENWKEDFTQGSEDINLTLNESGIDLKNANENSVSLFLDSSEISDSLIHNSKENFTDRFVLFFLEIKNNNVKTYDEILEKYSFEKRLVDVFIFKRAKDYTNFSNEKLSEIIYEKIPIVAFIYMPFFVIFLNFLNRKQDILYLEHLVFTFHVQTVLFMLLAIGTFISLFMVKIGETVLDISVFIVFPVYLYIALKRFYHYKNHKRATLMFITTNIGYVIGAILAFLANIIFAFLSF